MMAAESLPTLPAPGSEVKTACGGLTKFMADSPRALQKDRWVFFCLAVCLQEFEQNPAASCYAGHIAAEEG